MNMRKAIIASMIIMTFLIAVPGQAQDRGTPHIGLNLSLFNSVIMDNFMRHINGVLNEGSTFEDNYKGQSGGFYLGFKLIDTDKAFLNLQAHVNLFTKEFSTETPNSTLTRKLKTSFGINLQPGFYLKSRFLLFFNFSIERGKFKFSKEGTSTTYDIDPAVPGYGFGGGIGYQVSPSICLKLQYQHNQYRTTSISSSFVTVDTIVDQIELSPGYDIFMLSVQYDFGPKE